MATALVLLNCVMLMVELELEGSAVGAKLGRADGLDLVELLPIFQAPYIYRSYINPI